MLDAQQEEKNQGLGFRLKYCGWIINGLSVFWVGLSFFILCMPPVVKDLKWLSMNYASVVLVLLTIVSLVGYKTWGANVFTGPPLDTDYLELHNIEAQSHKVAKNEHFAIDEDDSMNLDGFNDTNDFAGKSQMLPMEDPETEFVRTSHQETEEEEEPPSDLSRINESRSEQTVVEHEETPINIQNEASVSPSTKSLSNRDDDQDQASDAWDDDVQFSDFDEFEEIDDDPQEEGEVLFDVTK